MKPTSGGHAAAVRFGHMRRGAPAADSPLRYHPWRPHTLVSRVSSVLVGVVTVAACLPLLSVLAMLTSRGLSKLSWSALTELPPAAGQLGGGFGNAILGTVVMVGIASLLAVPCGVLAGLWLAEFARSQTLSSVVRFSAKVLTGLPSILAGVFAYAVVVVTTGTFSALAGGAALSLLMLPTVLLTAEEAFRSVPEKMKAAAFGLGATPTQVALTVTVPTARGGLLTGVMLAVARAAGETAPLLFTALFSNYWLHQPLAEPTASLAVFIYNTSSVPYRNQVEMAWVASLVLVFGVLAINVLCQFLLRKREGE